MQKEYLNVKELAAYLNVKGTTIYSWVESGEIPHYKIRRLIRFKKLDVDHWLENHRKGCIDVKKEAIRILKGATTSSLDIDRVIKKAIEGVKEKEYNPSHGKPDRIKGLRKEVQDGTL
jgi:excisionase family DNA binding protein